MKNTIKFSGNQALERAADKRGKLLRWLWEWGFTDRFVAGQLWGTARSTTYKTISSMLKEGLIKECEISGVPVPLLHLTRAAVELLVSTPEMLSDDWLAVKPIVYGSRVSTKQPQHDLLAQRLVLTIKNVKGVWSERYLHYHYDSTAKLLAKNKKVNHQPSRKNFLYSSGKLPDGLILANDGEGGKHWLALEVVENIPSPKERRRILWLYAEAYRKNRIQGVIFASSRPTLLDLFKKTSEGNCGAWQCHVVGGRREWREETNANNFVEGTDHIDFVDDYFRAEGLHFFDLSDHKKSLYQVRIK